MKLRKTFCALLVGAIFTGSSLITLQAKTVNGNKASANGTMNWSISGGMVFGRKEYSSILSNSKKVSTAYVDLTSVYYTSGASAGQNQKSSKSNNSSVGVSWSHSIGTNSNRLTIFSGFQTICTTTSTVNVSLVE